MGQSCELMAKTWNISRAEQDRVAVDSHLKAAAAWKEGFYDDLVVPHPRPTNRGPRVAFGGMRTDHDSYKRLRIDCSALGLRLRRSHDLRRTGITLYREDGAEKDILHLCTHGAPGSDVMELYTSFGWAKLCAQVRPLKLARQKPLRRRLEGYPLCPDLCAASRRRAIAPHRSSWSMFPAAANTKNEATSTL